MQTPSFGQRPRSPKATQYYFILLVLFSIFSIGFLFDRLHGFSRHGIPAFSFMNSMSGGEASFPYTNQAYHVQNSHPRLFATPEMWLRLPELIARDPYLARWNVTIFDKAQALYEKPTVNITSELRLRGSGILDEAREVQLRIKYWAYVYRMTKQSRWKHRIWEEILASTKNSTLNTESTEDLWNSR
jgi:hypothetical protein